MESTSNSAPEIKIREAGPDDVPAMVACRGNDPEMGPADARMGRYLLGEHHPGYALAPRVIYVAIAHGAVVGYIGGHLTRRFDCDGELQYLYVAAPQRRSGVASRLLRQLVAWFAEHDAARVCVDVVPENARARAFYTRHGAVELSDYWMVWSDIQAASRALAE